MVFINNYMKKPKVSIYKYGRSLNKALHLIQKFKEKNNIDFKLDIKLDLDEKDLGYFLYNKNDNTLYINPVKCSNTNKKSDLHGNPIDCSIFATTVHEFSHFLDQKYKLLPEYTSKNFGLERLIMTKYAKKDLIEELADLVALYLINPYCIKLIDIERFKWLKTKFESPVPCGEKTFLNYYYRWSDKKQIDFNNKYGICVEDDSINKIEVEK